MSRMNKAPDPSALLAFATGAGESLSEMRAKVDAPEPAAKTAAEPLPKPAARAKRPKKAQSEDSATEAAPRKRRSRKAESARAAAVEKGKIPKIPKNFRIRQDLAERIEAIVAVSEMNQTDLLETALEAFLDKMEARYEELTGQKVPRATAVRLLD